MREVIEWVIQEAHKTLENASESDSPAAVAYAGFSAMVQLLGTLLEEVAALRDDLSEES